MSLVRKIELQTVHGINHDLKPRRVDKSQHNTLRRDQVERRRKVRKKANRAAWGRYRRCKSKHRAIDTPGRCVECGFRVRNPEAYTEGGG